MACFAARNGNQNEYGQPDVRNRIGLGLGGKIMTTSNLIRQEITIVNELGLHARPAAEFVRTTKAFRSQVWIVKEGERFSAASILEVLTANLNRGDVAIIEADGPDAEEAVKRLADLVREFENIESDNSSAGSHSAEADF